jgi:protein transport protein SEC61 subunit beta
MVVSPSSTTAGSGSGGARGLRPGGAPSGSVRQRRTTTTASPRPRTAGAGSSGLLRFYTEDSPGLKVGPVPVLVMSLIFIASVFVLHIWGKYTRS